MAMLPVHHWRRRCVWITLGTPADEGATQMDTTRCRRPTADAAGDQGAADEDAELFWERHYRTRRTWGVRVNPLLAETAAPLRPGAALDLGCGAGGDATGRPGRTE